MFDFLPLKRPDMVPTAALAYVGDAVFELYVRSLLAAELKSGMDAMHGRAVSSVRASAQAEMLHLLEGMLTDEEAEIVRRGRNVKSGHVPKSAGVIEYRYSTGFESLMGYLYLKGDSERLNALLSVLKARILSGGEESDESEADKLDT